MDVKYQEKALHNLVICEPYFIKLDLLDILELIIKNYVSISLLLSSLIY